MKTSIKHYLRTFFALLSFASVCLPAGRAFAQSAAPPMAVPTDGVAVLGHVHLLVADVDANKKFWVAMGGMPITLGSGPTANEGVVIGTVRILLRKADNIGPAAGAGINHIGFYVPNVEKAMAGWKAAGLKTAAGRSAQQGFVWTPGDLLQIEILEMPGQTTPIVFHHVHYYVYPGSAGGTAEMQAWYIKMFGAVAGKRGAFDTATLPNAELTFTKSGTPVTPTAGRAVDHVGFQVKNLKAYCAKLEAGGMKLNSAYTERADAGLAIAFITDPWGNRIELNEQLAVSAKP